jgi:hypothetical protein
VNLIGDTAEGAKTAMEARGIVCILIIVERTTLLASIPGLQAVASDVQLIHCILFL